MQGHVTKRASGKWAFVIDVGRDAVTGKRKQKWQSGFATKSEAERAMRAMLGRVDRGEPVDPDRTLLRDYLRTWLDGRASELAPLTMTKYRQVVADHVAPAPIGGMPLGKVRRAHLRAFETHLRDEKSLGTATRDVIFAVLSRSLGDAVDDELILSNPATKLGRARRGESREPGRFTVWTAAELRSLLEQTADDRLAALWRVAVTTGLRRGELAGLTWLGYSSEKRTITVSQQVVPTRGGATVQPVKTKRSNRTIRIDDETAEALERRREAMLAERDAAGDAWEDHDLIFSDELGRPINTSRLTEAFAKHRATAKLRAGRLHDLRHTHATHLLTGGVPVHVVSARLGHTSPVVTMVTYAHVLPTSDERAAEVMAAVLA